MEGIVSRNIKMIERTLAELWPAILKEALLRLNESMSNQLNSWIKKSVEQQNIGIASI
jgi:hypothetical protein